MAAYRERRAEMGFMLAGAAHEYGDATAAQPPHLLAKDQAERVWRSIDDGDARHGVTASPLRRQAAL